MSKTPIPGAESYVKKATRSTPARSQRATEQQSTDTTKVNGTVSSSVPLKATRVAGLTRC